MCCFAGKVLSVTGTNIFARSAGNERELLAYEMKLSSSEDNAMILPLPVPPKSAETAIRWISLKDYPDFFEDLRHGFPEPKADNGPPTRGARGEAKGSLEVVEVGDFEASFVPSVADFTRLDARFRLPEGVWDKLPAYKDWGFAVFKLKKGAKKVHPMAFEFPRRDKAQLFFPTVHVHDGEVHEKADFDHSLYCQKHEGDAFTTLHWTESPQLASQFMKAGKDAGLVLADQHVFRLQIHGEHKNEDTVLKA